MIVTPAVTLTLSKKNLRFIKIKVVESRRGGNHDYDKGGRAGLATDVSAAISETKRIFSNVVKITSAIR